MLRAFYVAFAVAVFGWVAVANYRGWSIRDSLATGNWNPAGRSYGRARGGGGGGFFWLRTGGWSHK